MKRRDLIKQLEKTGAQSVPVAMRLKDANDVRLLSTSSLANIFSRSALIATGTDCAPVNLAKSIIKKLSNE